MIDYQIYDSLWNHYTGGFVSLEEAQKYIDMALDMDPASSKTNFAIYKRERIEYA